MAAHPLDLAAHYAVLRLGRSALAWEVLRRDPGYRAAYASLPCPPEPGTAADPAFVANWGMHFR